MRPVELARALGLTQPSIANWESGKTSPSIERLPDIAKALGVTMEDLYGRKRAA